MLKGQILLPLCTLLTTAHFKMWRFSLPPSCTIRRPHSGWPLTQISVISYLGQLKRHSVSAVAGMALRHKCWPWLTTSLSHTCHINTVVTHARCWVVNEPV